VVNRLRRALPSQVLPEDSRDRRNIKGLSLRRLRLRVRADTDATARLSACAAQNQRSH